MARKSEDDDENELVAKLPPQAKEVLEKLVHALQGKDGEQDDRKLTQVAVIVALAASILFALVLVLAGPDAPQKAAALDDPKALRPVDLKADPGDDAGSATTGRGGMRGDGGFGGYLLLRNHPEKTPCAEQELGDAVRRTSGLNMINGRAKKGEAPCVPTN